MKNEDDFGIIIEIILFVSAAINFFSSFMWLIMDTFGKDPNDNWVIRGMVGVISLGFFGILRKLRINKE